MKTFKPRNLDDLNNRDSMLGTCLQDLQDAINNLAAQVNGSGVGDPDPPLAPTQLNVVAAGGIFDAKITDNNPVNRGVVYFLEYSASPAFLQPVQIHLGPARNWRGSLGNQTLYWRCYAQYPTTVASDKTYYGSQSSPTAVSGGGSTTGPAPQTSSGSGTSSGNGTQGGQGYGNNPTRSGRASNQRL